MKLLWRCRKSVPHLHVQPGDTLIYQPGERCPYLVVRAVSIDPGAIMGAEYRGDLEAVTVGAAPSPPCRVLPFAAPARAAAPPPWRSLRKRAAPA